MEESKTVYLSLGSNVGDKINNLQDAVFSIHKTIGDVSKISPVYQSSSWGFESEDFLNICITVFTTMKPSPLLDALLGMNKPWGELECKKKDIRLEKLISIFYTMEVKKFLRKI